MSKVTKGAVIRCTSSRCHYTVAPGMRKLDLATRANGSTMKDYCLIREFDSSQVATNILRNIVRVNKNLLNCLYEDTDARFMKNCISAYKVTKSQTSVFFTWIWKRLPSYSLSWRHARYGVKLLTKCIKLP